MKSLLIVYSYHHHNTEKISQVLAKILDAQIKRPHEINPEELSEYELVGFGSGIYGGKFHNLCSLWQIHFHMSQMVMHSFFQLQHS